MSFIFCNGLTSEIIDILPDRRKHILEQYFMKYSLEARSNVEFVVCDIYSPYISLVNDVFPNAEVILDKFHIIQNFTRAFNFARISEMKHFSPFSNEYRLLKKYWKLLLMPRSSLNSTVYRKFSYFDGFNCQKNLVEFMLSLSDKLRACYNFMQDMCFSIRSKSLELLNITITSFDDNSKLNDKLSAALNTTKDYIDLVANMMKTSFTNGRPTGINNKIKLIKRVAYGYRSFTNYY